MKKNGTFGSIIITLIYTLVVYYLFYPALNIHNPGFWVFVISIMLVFGSAMSILTLGIAVSELFRGIRRRKNIGFLKVFLAVPIIILLIFILNIIYQ